MVILLPGFAELLNDDADVVFGVGLEGEPVAIGDEAVIRGSVFHQRHMLLVPEQAASESLQRHYRETRSVRY